MDTEGAPAIEIVVQKNLTSSLTIFGLRKVRRRDTPQYRRSSNPVHRHHVTPTRRNMAAAPPPVNFSTLLGTADLWEDPTPNYVAIDAAVGVASAGNRNAVRQSLLNVAARTPTAIAFLLDSGPGFIYIGHSPALHPAGIGDAAPFDDHLIVMVGDDPSNITGVPLQHETTAR